MTRITTFSEANLALQAYIPADIVSSYNLTRIKKFMRYIGNPQEKLKLVHVAGTSGKTSTSYYAASLLQATGATVGLTVSPHIDQINERLQINLIPLPEAEYCAVLSEFLDILEASQIQLTYFELLVAMAYWYFDKIAVDYAVIEVGLGGLLDSTNVVRRPDKVCVITDIGYDHMAILGKTIREIALQKAGIIQKGNEVFVNHQDKKVIDVFTETCQRQGATLHFAKPFVPADDLPGFQQRNWQLAKTVTDFITFRDGLTVANDADKVLSRYTQIPGRMELFSYKTKQVLIDGAHNEQKVAALVDGMRDIYPNQKVNLVVAFGENKSESVMPALDVLHELSERIYITQFKNHQDVQRKSIDPQKIADICRQLGYQQIMVVEEPIEALNQAVTEQTDITLVAGSFYLLNEIRPRLKG